MLKLTAIAFISVCVALSFALFIDTGSISQKTLPQTVSYADISIDTKTGNRIYRGHAFTGTAVTYHPNETKIRAEQFVNGRRDGFLKRWFPDGKLAFTAFYKNSRREGTTTSWWSNGNMRSQTQYLNDKANGSALSWYRSGEKFKKYNFAAGKPSGLQQGWRLNGKLFSNFEYKNGRAYGLKNSNLCVELNDEKMFKS